MAKMTVNISNPYGVAQKPYSLGITPAKSGTSGYATTSTTPYGRYGDKAQAWRDQQIYDQEAAAAASYYPPTMAPKTGASANHIPSTIEDAYNQAYEANQTRYNQGLDLYKEIQDLYANQPTYQAPDINALVKQITSLYSQSITNPYGAAQSQTQQAIDLYKNAPNYDAYNKQVAATMKNQEELVNQQKQTDLAASAQNLVSSGLYNTSVNAGLPLAWEKQVGATARGEIQRYGQTMENQRLQNERDRIASLANAYTNQANVSQSEAQYMAQQEEARRANIANTLSTWGTNAINEGRYAFGAQQDTTQNAINALISQIGFIQGRQDVYPDLTNYYNSQAGAGAVSGYRGGTTQTTSNTPKTPTSTQTPVKYSPLSAPATGYKSSGVPFSGGTTYNAQYSAYNTWRKTKGLPVVTLAEWTAMGKPAPQVASSNALISQIGFIQGRQDVYPDLTNYYNSQAGTSPTTEQSQWLDNLFGYNGLALQLYGN